MWRELKRKNKQLAAQECISILKAEKRGVLSVNGDEGYPYGMPMNHYYNEADGKIYFHSGREGYRTDCLLKSDKVSFCVYDGGYTVSGKWALNIKSVIVFGRMRIVDDIKRVEDIAAGLCRKFTEDGQYIQSEIEKYAHETLLLELTPEHICGKIVEES